MSPEIAQYAAAVGAALADLPETTRTELLEDLPAHLAEVAAEVEAEGGTLEDRLGSPAAYAAELRATLGTPFAPDRRARLTAAAVRIRDRLRTADTRLGKLVGYASLSEFGRLLRPAWWVLRGYLVAWIIANVVSSHDSGGLLPRFNGDVVSGLVFTAVCMCGSIWWAKNPGRRVKPWQRFASATVSVGLAIVGFAIFVTMDNNLAYPRPSYSQPSPWVDVSWYGGGNVAVVDSSGRVLDGVSIVDLNTQSYVDVKIHNCGAILVWEYERWPLLTRLCNQHPALPTATPSPAALTPTPMPTPTPTPASSP